MCKEKEKKTIYADLFDKILTGVIFTFVLAAINHMFWKEQQSFTAQQKLIEQKTENYSKVSAALTSLIANHNTIHSLNSTEPSECDEECNKRKSDAASSTKILLSELASQLALTRIYFDVNDELTNLKDRLSSFDDKAETLMDSSNRAVVSASNLTNAMSKSIKDDLRKH